jgi:hypothetical protein
MAYRDQQIMRKHCVLGPKEIKEAVLKWVYENGPDDPPDSAGIIYRNEEGGILLVQEIEAVWGQPE